MTFLLMHRVRIRIEMTVGQRMPGYVLFSINFSSYLQRKTAQIHKSEQCSYLRIKYERKKETCDGNCKKGLNYLLLVYFQKPHYCLIEVNAVNCLCQFFIFCSPLLWYFATKVDTLFCPIKSKIVKNRIFEIFVG